MKMKTKTFQCGLRFLDLSIYAFSWSHSHMVSCALKNSNKIKETEGKCC